MVLLLLLLLLLLWLLGTPGLAGSSSCLVYLATSDTIAAKTRLLKAIRLKQHATEPCRLGCWSLVLMHGADQTLVGHIRTGAWNNSRAEQIGLVGTRAGS
jgi:hypothetical protein